MKPEQIVKEAQDAYKKQMAKAEAIMEIPPEYRSAEQTEFMRMWVLIRKVVSKAVKDYPVKDKTDLLYLEDQREHVRELVRMAKDEVNAGNEHMRPDLEGYMHRLCAIGLEIQNLKLTSSFGKALAKALNPPKCP